MKTLSVILADDDKLVLQDLKSLVKWNSLGFKILAAVSDGLSALNLIEKHNPDLFITDINMPGLNGLDLIEMLRKNHPRMKILIITAFDEFDYVKRAIHNDVMDYILKTEITGPVLSQKLSDIYNFYQNEKQITSHILSQELTQFFQNPDLILDAPSFPGLYDKKDQLWHFGIITWNQNFVRDFNRMLDTVSVC